MWHYLKNGEAQGPISVDQLRQLIASRSLNATDLVWREGMAEWASIKDVPDRHLSTSQGANQSSAPGSSPQQGPLVTLKGLNGILYIFESHVVISRSTIVGWASQGLKGDRTIYYKDITGIEYRRPSLLANGYIQFIVPGTASVDATPSMFSSSMKSMKDANTITLRSFGKEGGDSIDRAYAFMMEKVSNKATASAPVVIQQVASGSVTDELRKFKGLLDDGIITQEEFERKKKELLK